MSQEMVPEESVQSPRRSGREIGYLAGRSLTCAGVLGLGGLSIYNYSKAAAYRLANDTIEGQQYLTDSSNFAIATAVAGAGYIAARIRENNDIRQGKISARRSNLGRFSLKTLGVLTVGSASTSAGLIHAGLLSDFNNMGILFPAAIGSGAFTAGLGVATATNYIWNRSRNLQYVNHSAPNYSSGELALVHQESEPDEKEASQPEELLSANAGISPQTIQAENKPKEIIPSLAAPEARRVSQPIEITKREPKPGVLARFLDKIGVITLIPTNKKMQEETQKIFRQQVDEMNKITGFKGNNQIFDYDYGSTIDRTKDGKVDKPAIPPTFNQIANNE